MRKKSLSILGNQFVALAHTGRYYSNNLGEFIIILRIKEVSHNKKKAIEIFYIYVIKEIDLKNYFL